MRFNDQTKHAVSQVSDRTAQTLRDGYEQAMRYGREHPGRMTMIALGEGFGLCLFQKVPLLDCFGCQWCSDDRCSLRRTIDPEQSRKKEKTHEFKILPH